MRTGIKPVYGPFPESCPDANPTLTQTLDLTQRREGKVGSSLITGHIPAHPFPEAITLTLTQTLDQSQRRVGTWPTTEHVPRTASIYLLD